MKIRGFDDGKISDSVVNAVRIFGAINHDNEEYGYFTIREGRTGEIFLVRNISVLLDGKAEKNFLLSLERSYRLFKNKNDESSWQSLNHDASVPGQPENSRPWGHSAGAIRCNNLIFSFSGTSSDLGDEAVMLFSSVQLGWLLLNQARGVAGLSQNHYFEDMIHSGINV